MRSAGWLLMLCVMATGCSGSKSRVVLYCAQDREFAEVLLDTFHKDHGLPVASKFDTESTKSVAAYFELIQEKNRPRCDVFWNNEILSTLRLQKQGLLKPYSSPSAQGLPSCRPPRAPSWEAPARRDCYTV